MKFNQKEMVVIAMKPKEEFDMEGVLAMREEDGKLFLKTESKFYTGLEHTVHTTYKLFQLLSFN